MFAATLSRAGRATLRRAGISRSLSTSHTFEFPTPFKAHNCDQRASRVPGLLLLEPGPGFPEAGRPESGCTLLGPQ